jgi:hypothetical protein
MKRVVWSLAIAMLLAGPAAAQTPAPDRQKLAGSRDSKSVRAALERYRKVGAGTKGEKLVPRVRPREALVGRLIRGGQGEVLLEREIDPRTASQLERMGYRPIRSEKEIADRTLMGNKVYVLYEMDAAAFIDRPRAELRGAPVRFEVRHDPKGIPVVTSLRRIER